MTRLLLAVALLVAAAPACGSSPATRTAAADYAPPPFPAEALRDAIRPGRTYLYRVVAVGAPEHRVRLRFLETGPEGAVYERAEWPATAAGPANGTMAEASWRDFESHAHYPREHTVVTDSEVAVPAGRYATRLYTVTQPTDDGHAEITRAHFAVGLPGPPVQTQVARDGQIMMTMSLLSFEAGAAAPK